MDNTVVDKVMEGQARRVNPNKVIDEGKFNKFFLIVVILLFLAIMFDGYDMTIYGVTLPNIMVDLNINPTQTGLLGSAALCGMMFGAIIFGMLSDVIGRKKVLIIARVCQ